MEVVRIDWEELLVEVAYLLSTVPASLLADVTRHGLCLPLVPIWQSLP
jgi:hypothetical protein